MTAPKIPDGIKDYLREIGLVIWACQHPLEYEYDVGGKRGRGRADKTQVHVQLAGPGLDSSPWGYGTTVLGAVNDALRNRHFRQQRPGLPGAMARLEIEIDKLNYAIKCWILGPLSRGPLKVDKVTGVIYLEVYDDDDIPF